ncbi:hypothetical protein FGO68_gene14405 [Halteria grandinella]|uniref:Ubiquitin-like domain-containing protein n=1 Tax=Halteria grandinella TaxID=5974 RepID=A0A8J8P273_HALGN|nr:hypothetical protein FGO68_gene14405 [Halteria grandinella]
MSKPPASSLGGVVSSLITGPGHGASFDSNGAKCEPPASDSISIKIKKSDSQIVKITISPSRDLVRELKERAFQKERDEGKNIRLIYQGKVLQDNDYLGKYNLKDGVFVHAFITEALVKKPENNQEATMDNSNPQYQTQNSNNTTEPEERLGFDRLLVNNAYSEIEVHAIRLQFHSIMMRVGIEKTNETSESLLENEEKWLNKQLPGPSHKLANIPLEDLRRISSVLSQRNDLVLPRYYYQPAVFEREGTWKEFARGFGIGFALTAFLLIFYMVWSAKPSRNRDSNSSLSKQERIGTYVGAFVQFALMYYYLVFTW